MTHPRQFLTVYQRLAPVGPVRANLFWLALVIILIGAAFAIPDEQLGGQRDAFIGLCVFQAVGIILVPMGIDWGYRILRDWAGDLDNFTRSEGGRISAWFLDDLAFISGGWLMSLAGILLGIVGIAAFYRAGYFEFYSLPAQLLAGVTMFVSASFAGMALFAIFSVSRSFWRLGTKERLTLKVHRHRFGIMSVGAALFKCWMIIGCIWAVYVASAFTGYPGTQYEKVIGLEPMWLLTYPTFPFIVGSFVICQIPLHRKMIAYKRARILRLDAMLDAIQPHEIGELDDERRSNIEFLEKQKDQVRSLPEWPFSLVSLLGTGASSVAAVFPALITEGVPSWVTRIKDLFT